MPYLTPGVTVRGTVSNVGLGSTWTLTATGAVAAGSTLVLAGGAATGGAQSVRITAITDTSGNTWSTLTNTTAAAAYSPNAIVAVAQNVAAGTPVLTITNNMTTDTRPNLVLLEVTNVPTTAVVDAIVTGQGDGVSFSITSNGTGVLTQTDFVAIAVGAGWIGDPSNPTAPTTWTEHMSIANGSGAGLIGTQVSSRVFTGSNTSISVTIPTPDVATTNGYCILLVLKAKNAGINIRYKFILDSAVFTSATTNITGFIWRNGTPDAVLAQRFTGLSGSATSGVLYITANLPTGVSVSDTLYGNFYTSTNTSGIIGGVVETF